MAREEGLSVIFPNVSIRNEAGFAAQIPCKLPAEITLDDNGVPRILQQIENSVSMQRNQPTDRQMIGTDALIPQKFAGLVDHPIGRAPTDQRDVGVCRAQ